MLSQTQFLIGLLFSLLLASTPFSALAQAIAPTETPTETPTATPSDVTSDVTSEAETPTRQQRLYLPLIIQGTEQGQGASALAEEQSTDEHPGLASVREETRILQLRLYLPLVIHSEEEPFVDEIEIVVTEPEAVIASALIATHVVSTTEDYKAMGYPDARKIVRDSKGNLYLAYRKKQSSRYRIFVAKSTNNGTSWVVLNHNQPIENIGAYNQRVPALAIDSQDRLHVVWYGNDINNSQENEREIKYVRSSAGGSSWPSARALADVPGYADQPLWQEHPTIYVNGSNVYVVWEGYDAIYTKRAQIKFMRSTDFGVTWTDWINIQPSDLESSSRPTLVVSYVGTIRQLYVLAYRGSGGYSQIYWSRSTDNGNNWETWQKVASSSDDQRHISVAVDSQNRLHLAWRQRSKTQSILRYRVYDPALKKFSDPATIASASGKCLFFPSITVSSSDKIWVTWTQSTDCTTLPADDPKSGQIFYVSKTAKGKWSSPIMLTTSGNHLYATLRRVNNPSAKHGNVDIVWLDISSSTQDATGAVICPPNACIIRHASLGAW